MASLYQEVTLERDRMELTFGDTIDVKAGVLLALIAVVATLTGGLLSFSKLGKTSGWIEMSALCALVVAGVLAFFALRPRDYMFPALPESLKTWRADLSNFYSEEDAAEAEMTKGLLAVAEERISTNHANNMTKVRYLNASFQFTLAGLGLNCVTLGIMGFIKLLS